MKERSLREKLLQGSFYLVARRAIGLIISLGGMLLLTGQIGTRAYGIFATVSIIISYLTDLSINGLHAYLVRTRETSERKTLDLAFTYLAGATFLFMLAGWALSGAFGVWFHAPEIRLPLIVSLGLLPWNIYIVPAMAMLERDLRYREVAGVEMSAQVAYYGPALCCAYWGFGVWAPVVGSFAQSAVTLMACARLTRYRPSFYWHTTLFKDMFTYGITHTVSMRIMGLRPLIGAMFIGRFIGPEGVAFVALAGRLINSLSFVNEAIQRMTFAVLARIQQDSERMKRGLNQALLLQVMSVAPFMIGFAVFSPWFVRLFFDPSWHSVLSLFPYMSIVCLVDSLFNVHINLLYVLGRNKEVIRYNLLHIVLFAGSAAVCVPQFGLPGYAAAEILSIFSFGVIYLTIKRYYSIRYKDALICTVVCIPPLFFVITPWPWSLLLFVPLLVYAVLPGPRERLVSLIAQWLFAGKKSSFDAS
ncbi:lipopolysaccharide biosynthesis protein [Paenibacillus glycanilyticus]|uniref:Lipopolysaccharide biosynthesis protein n=1 Tax=Paenibacillus glycanilyticus TaxID=126569 RepID=A0ABQ6NNJ6_9BACL|nr:oligosaccharide flippase family protein [Paenibacillus glycanilyticus]GMK46692.1 lipopolysaccharide biosynthesis protein [Paenibacillus glycanilyticus]